MDIDGAARQRLFAAGIEWAAGGPGRPLVDACAQALVDGLDGPTLRVLAGGPAASADEEAVDLAPAVFEELGLPIAPRRTTEAIVDGARLTARRFLDEPVQHRALVSALWQAYSAAGYPDELLIWSGLDDKYEMIRSGIIDANDRYDQQEVEDAARALVATPTSQGVDLRTLVIQPGPT